MTALEVFSAFSAFCLLMRTPSDVGASLRLSIMSVYDVKERMKARSGEQAAMSNGRDWEIKERHNQRQGCARSV